MKLISLLKGFVKTMHSEKVEFDTIGIKLPTSEFKKVQHELSDYQDVSVAFKSDDNFEGFYIRAYGVRFIIEELK